MYTFVVLLTQADMVWGHTDLLKSIFLGSILIKCFLITLHFKRYYCIYDRKKENVGEWEMITAFVVPHLL